MTLADYKEVRGWINDNQCRACWMFQKWHPPVGGIEQWFAERGISPTLAEYCEVASCAATGDNPLGIH